jgi:hypothetical protein
MWLAIYGIWIPMAVDFEETHAGTAVFFQLMAVIPREVQNKGDESIAHSK